MQRNLFRSVALRVLIGTMMVLQAFSLSSCSQNTTSKAAASSEPRPGDEEMLPAPPANLRAYVFSNTRIDLSWENKADNNSGFRIERSNGVGFNCIATVDSSTTTYSDSALQPMKTYTYRVCALNNAGMSAYSSEISATTPVPDNIMPEDSVPEEP